MNNTNNNARIARNTLMLYFRLLITIVVTLYVSRVLLSALGVEDYGIYNVVGGVVTMFTMISTSLSSAISRFITFELGKRGESSRLGLIFSTSLVIQIIIAALIAVLVESVGVWFLENRMVIPIERIESARWVLHFSLMTLVFKVVSVPYSATIIAHERISAYAYICIAEVLLTLGAAFAISSAPSDRLTTYAALIASAAAIVLVIYMLYCRRHFAESRFRWIYDKPLMGEMFSFAGWNFIGSSSAILRDHGGNILLNIFGGGVVVNAARAISMQVNGAVMSFVTNFMVALNPQITKSYASGDRAYMMTLVFQGSRLSFYMLLFLSLPIIISTPYILNLWLGSTPEYSVTFVRLALIFGLCESVSQPLIAAMLATGKIRNYQIVVGGLQLMNIPISYVLLRSGYPPQVVLFVAIFISLCCLAARLYMLRGMISLSVKGFMRHVVANIVVVATLSAIVPLWAARYMPDNVWGTVAISLVSLCSTMSAIYCVGCNHAERELINQQLSKLLGR
ncbi:MAG: lipopolysaccharide biosynthesis protein [Rikenellaceae bacterium]